jgi:hypothetical protein
MWKDFKTPIQKIMREIIDQKYGPKTAPQLWKIKWIFNN